MHIQMLSFASLTIGSISVLAMARVKHQDKQEVARGYRASTRHRANILFCLTMSNSWCNWSSARVCHNMGGCENQISFEMFNGLGKQLFKHLNHRWVFDQPTKTILFLLELNAMPPYITEHPPTKRWKKQHQLLASDNLKNPKPEAHSELFAADGLIHIGEVEIWWPQLILSSSPA